ncbi:MAG TPA: ABC transporter permease [Steroidobacteraceae bacterium]|nr:ABC transporter permease [Steroidobacteraceae bacterium]
MKYLPLVWVSLWRNRVRTSLALVSIALAFFLFGLLDGVNAGLRQVIAQQAADIVSVRARFQRTLPISHLQQIRKTPGVLAVSPIARMSGQYQHPGNDIAILMTDVHTYSDVEYTMDVTPDDLAALRRSRTAVLVTPAAIARYGWKVGDRVPVQTSIVDRNRNTTWEFIVAGTFREKDEPKLVGMWGNYDYLDEGRVRDAHTVNEFVARVVDADHSAEISKQIDAAFENSAFPTKTRTERDQAESFISQVGGIGYFVSTVIVAAFLTLLSLTSHVTMQGIRERVPEFALLKALGYSTLLIHLLVIMEVALLSVCAAASGLILAWILYPRIIPLPLTHLPWHVLLQGLGVAIALTAATTLVPVLRLRRLRVAQALMRL